MTTISSVGGSAWSSAAAMQRTQQRRGPSPEDMLSKLDSDGNGSVSGTELQGLLDKVAKKGGADGTAADAGELVSRYDSDGDGNLNAQELGKTLESLMPQRSTMDFAQTRGAGASPGQAGDDLFGKVDADGDGSVSQAELQSLVAKMSGASDGSTSATDAESTELFKKLDSDGDGQLSEAEFDAGRPSDQRDSRVAGGMPPPPGGAGGPGGPGGPAGAGSTSATSDSTTYDPLDTNEDGTVSAAERAAGAASGKDAVTALFNAIDTDGDKTLSNSEAQSFITQLAGQYAAASSTADASGSSGTTSNAATGDGRRLDLARLADMARQRYEAAAADWAGSGRSSAVSATA
ncbi:XopAW family type III secretion system calcium-binding effector [Paracidovorax cattleyae]|uniref:Ca2+-binding protein, EF-hand superfamily n=1 Tax=Paracidovorax cattleyae TaxID=80868 RepID=A0A1H0NWQ1_9BURK|nr:XopAW family type III secretion system calcium-binding effector [Paracidovorax cattleyae]AVS75142.1 calcium-binding protein [Paracidovorax cattleyae]MBF9266236.1 EF-hand domain-containing protein [Paracidovorax cattleyae]SDO96855.1 Ca2+-binding protein, EF-hand superfamily [Paracidovorax cattleyae]